MEDNLQTIPADYQWFSYIAGPSTSANLFVHRLLIGRYGCFFGDKI